MFHLIEAKRKQMLITAKIYGLSSTKVLTCSQQLDELLNIYETMKHQIQT